MLARFGQAADGVLDQDDPAVHDQAEVNGPQGQQVRGDAELLHPDDREHQGQRDQAGDDERPAQVTQKEQEDGDDEEAAFKQVLLDRADGFVHELGAVVDCGDTDAWRQFRPKLANLVFHGQGNGA